MTSARNRSPRSSHATIAGKDGIDLPGYHPPRQVEPRRRDETVQPGGRADRPRWLRRHAASWAGRDSGEAPPRARAFAGPRLRAEADEAAHRERRSGLLHLQEGPGPPP